MSNYKKSFETKLNTDHSPEGLYEGKLYDQPFIFASGNTNDSFKYNLPVFPIKEKIAKKDLKAHRASLKLTQHQKDALTAAFLGKTASFPSKKSNRIRFKVDVLRQSDYFCTLYGLFENWAIAAPVLHEKSSRSKVRKGRSKHAGVKISKSRLKRTRISMYFDIHKHPVLDYYKDQFFMESPYKKGKKVRCVPKDINPLLTARALSYLFLDRGFFNPTSVDDTSFWESYSFRLDHLHYYKQISQVLLEKFGLIIIHGLDISHTAYSYNKRNRYKKLLYVKGESRKILIDLIKPSLPTKYHQGLLVSDDYLKLVESRQKATKGLDYDYWFPRNSKGQLGRSNQNKKPLEAVKDIITSNDKTQRWLANGHKGSPEQTFDTKMTLGKRKLPAGILPTKCFPVAVTDYWPSIGPRHTFKPSFISSQSVNDLIDFRSHKGGASFKSSFLKTKLKSVIEPEKDKDN